MATSGPKISTNNLLTYFDVYNTDSYTSGSSLMRNIYQNPEMSASLVQGATLYVNRVEGLVFSASNAIYRFSNHSFLINKIKETDNITIEMFIKPMAKTIQHRVFEINQTEPSGIFYSFIFGGVSAFSMSVFSNGGEIISKTNLTPNVWQYISYTNSGSFSQSLYVNGIKQNQTESNPSLGQSGANVAYIGASRAATEYYSGSLGMFRIYNVALSDQEIQENYNAFKSRFGLT